MKILLTGASGFIGKKIRDRLIQNYSHESVILLTSKAQPDFNCIVYDDLRNVNIKNYDFSEIDIVIHAGAFTPKNNSDTNLIKQCNDNIHFTEQLLLLPFKKLRKVINLSTLDVYANATVISEDSLIEPASYYGMTKLCCEHMVKTYCVANGIEYQALRIGHVYGPGEEKYKKVLPIIISNIIKNLPVEIWGDGLELRSFIYIDDVVSAIISAINKSTIDIINVVSGNSISIKDLVNTLIDISKKNVEVVHRKSLHVKRDFIFDNAKLRNNLLKEETPFLEGLQAEYKYMEAFLENNI